MRNNWIEYLSGCLVAIPLVIFVLLLGTLITSAIVMWIWNTWFITTFTIFGLPVLGYWQSFWICLMFRLLFAPNVNVKNSK